MNVAAFISGPVVDGFNIGLMGGCDIGEYHFSANRLVILTTTVTAICSIIISYLYVRDVQVEDCTPDNDVLVAKQNIINTNMIVGKETNISPLHEEAPSSDNKSDIEATNVQATTFVTQVQSFTPDPKSPLDTIKILCFSKTFWRFAILTLFLVNLHAIFRHLDATFPTYLIRVFGSDVPKGTIYSINPFMIIFLTPLVASLTASYDHFDMIKYGGYVSAASPFFLAVSTTITACVCMVVLLSLGEAIWSPRLYDYVMTIAPDVSLFYELFY